MTRNNLINVQDRTKYKCECCNKNYDKLSKLEKHIAMKWDVCHHNLRVRLGIEPIGGAR